MSRTSPLQDFARYTSLNVLGMIALSCYILADTFFVSLGLGADGLAALNLAIPIYNFIHGSGLMIGIEIDGSGAELRRRLLFDRHIFTGGAGASTVRLLPALCLTRDLADRFLTAFKAILR